jgi:hypothetical protein
MSKIIRLTESDLERIVRRVVKEQRTINEDTNSVLSALKSEKSQQALSGCWNGGREYPNIKKIMVGHAQISLSVLAGMFTALAVSSGVGAGAAVPSGSVAVAAMVKGIDNLSETSRASLKSEVCQLIECITGFSPC